MGIFSLSENILVNIPNHSKPNHKHLPNKHSQIRSLLILNNIVLKTDVQSIQNNRQHPQQDIPGKYQHGNWYRKYDNNSLS